MIIMKIAFRAFCETMWEMMKQKVQEFYLNSLKNSPQANLPEVWRRNTKQAKRTVKFLRT